MRRFLYMAAIAILGCTDPILEPIPDKDPQTLVKEHARITKRGNVRNWRVEVDGEKARYQTNLIGKTKYCELHFRTISIYDTDCDNSVDKLAFYDHNSEIGTRKHYNGLLEEACKLATPENETSFKNILEEKIK